MTTAKQLMDAVVRLVKAEAEFAKRTDPNVPLEPALAKVKEAYLEVRQMAEEMENRERSLRATAAMLNDQAERAVQGCEFLRAELDHARAEVDQLTATADYLARQIHPR